MIIVITVSGEKRIPPQSRDFIRLAEQTIDVKEVGVDLRGRDSSLLHRKYDLSFAEFYAGGALSSGEIGCLLSHQQAYNLIAEKGAPWALIIEDDVELLLSYESLKSLIVLWENHRFELVHLYPGLGGVIVGGEIAKTRLALTPPILTNCYWISSSGAKKLMTRNDMIGGLADWPIQIAKVKMRAISSEVAKDRGEGISVIGPTNSNKSAHRIPLAHRRYLLLFNQNSFAFLMRACRVYGIRPVLKQLFFYRFYRRFFRILTGGRKGTNHTIFTKFK
jgi:glycosyl transferase, family 25